MNVYNKSKNDKITLGLVAARKGSQGLKGKNLIKIQNQVITKTALKLALKCNFVDAVILSSDSEKILKLIKDNKKLIKLKRNKNLSKNSTPMLPVIKDAVNFFEKKIDKKVSKIIIFDPTTPLRNIGDVQKANRIFIKKKPDLLLSVHGAQHNPYFSMVEKEKKYFQLSKNPNKNPGARQQVPKVYEINTVVWIYSKNAIFHENRRIPKKTIIFKTPVERSIDINTKDDISRIYYYLKKKKKGHEKK